VVKLLEHRNTLPLSLSFYTSDVNLSVQSFLDKFLLLYFETFNHIIVCELIGAD